MTDLEKLKGFANEVLLYSLAGSLDRGEIEEAGVKWGLLQQVSSSEETYRKTAILEAK